MGVIEGLALTAVLVMGFLISAAVAWVLSHGAIPALHILDHPNQRSLHERPVPRTGGLAVLSALVVVLMPCVLIRGLAAEVAWIAAAGALIASVSFLDDRGDVPRRYRLLAQFAGAGLLIAGGLGVWIIAWPGTQWLLPVPVALALTLLFVVWMINLYNFMDGIDGLAGGMAVFGFGALAALGWQGGDLSFTLTAATIAAAAGGFLSSNFPRARLFLGDVGSSTLGLLAAALALWGSGAGLFPLWVAGLVFSPFIVDATWTLLHRLVRGERLWLPHRSHHYQRLVLAGWSHRRTALWSYLLMAAVGASALAATKMAPQDQWLLLAFWAVIYGLIHIRVRNLEHHVADIET